MNVQSSREFAIEKQNDCSIDQHYKNLLKAEAEIISAATVEDIRTPLLAVIRVLKADLLNDLGQFGFDLDRQR